MDGSTGSEYNILTHQMHHYDARIDGSMTLIRFITQSVGVLGLRLP
jgi:hypothetical protein